MVFTYKRKCVNTSEAFVLALTEGYIDVVFSDELSDNYEREKNLITLLTVRKNESPMIAWRYARALIHPAGEWLYIEDNEDSPFDILQSLAEQDFAPAMHLLSQCGRDPEISMGWMKRAIELEYGPALYDAGFAKYYFPKTDSDQEEGFSLIKQAQALGVPDAIYMLAEHYKELEDPRVIDYCRLGVDAGNDRCAYMLAEYYREGKFVERDDCYAAELYEKCTQWYRSPGDGDVYDAAEPLCSAYFALGELCANNLLPNSTQEKAFEYYKLGADCGSDDACYRVADMYEHGIGTTINYQEAAQYYGRCRSADKVSEVTAALIRLGEKFEQALANCLCDLGDFYQQYAKNEEQTKACYEKSFELGCVNAGYRLQTILGRQPREAHNFFKGSFFANLEAISVEEQPSTDMLQVFNDEDLPF